MRCPSLSINFDNFLIVYSVYQNTMLSPGQIPLPTLWSQLENLTSYYLACKLGLEKESGAIEEEDSVENVEEGLQERWKAAEHLQLSWSMFIAALMDWDEVAII